MSVPDDDGPDGGAGPPPGPPPPPRGGRSRPLALGRGSFPAGRPTGDPASDDPGLPYGSFAPPDDTASAGPPADAKASPFADVPLSWAAPGPEEPGAGDLLGPEEPGRRRPRRRSDRDRASRSAAAPSGLRRLLLCPECAAELDNWTQLPIVGADDTPISVTVDGVKTELTPELLEQGRPAVVGRAREVKAYRRCPNGDKLPLDYGKRPVITVPIMGRKNGGKTRFLGVLHQLIMEGALSELGWEVRLEDAPGVSTYAAELERYIDMDVSETTLERFNLHYRFHPGPEQARFARTDGFNLVLFDMPGELYAPVDREHPRVPQVSMADGIVLLVDADDMASGAGRNQYNHMVNRLGNQLNDEHPYLRAFHRKSGWQWVPIAVGVSKSDRITTRLDPRFAVASQGHDMVTSSGVSDTQIDRYCLGYLHDIGGPIGRMLLNRVAKGFIFSSWAFTSSYDEEIGTSQAWNTLYLFGRLMRHVIAVVDAVESRSLAEGGRD